MGAAASPVRSITHRQGLAGSGHGLALLLPLLLAGCSGTAFGDRLARSFSAPAAPPARSRPPVAGPAAGAGAETPGETPVGKPTDGALPLTPGAPRAPAVGPGPSPSSQAPAAKARPAAQPPSSPATGPRAAQPSSLRPAAPATPAPYRVTLRLPQADPSAPAEVVTRALRAAGVPFEVETIERMGQTPAALTPRPALAPRP